MAVKCPMKEAWNGHGATEPGWALCFRDTLFILGDGGKGCCNLFLIANISLGFPFVCCRFFQISFQMTHCITNDGT